MQNKEVFEYAFIRFVPKVEREEFINVGVIVFSKRKNFLAVKYHIDKTRLSAFSSEVDFQELENYLKSWDLICKSDPQGGPIAKLDTPTISMADCCPKYDYSKLKSTYRNLR